MKYTKKAFICIAIFAGLMNKINCMNEEIKFDEDILEVEIKNNSPYTLVLAHIKDVDKYVPLVEIEPDVRLTNFKYSPNKYRYLAIIVNEMLYCDIPQQYSKILIEAYDHVPKSVEYRRKLQFPEMPLFFRYKNQKVHNDIERRFQAMEIYKSNFKKELPSPNDLINACKPYWEREERALNERKMVPNPYIPPIEFYLSHIKPLLSREIGNIK